MEQLQRIWNASLLGRLVTALCLWCGRQWQRSWLVYAFLHPTRQLQDDQNSLCFKLWLLVRRLCSALFHALRLDRLLEGSVFQNTAFWAMAAVVLAPFLPTMAVLAVVMAGFFSLAIRLAEERSRPLAASPVNRYLLLYALAYLAAGVLSVSPASSLPVSLLMCAFILFAFLLENAIRTRSQLDLLIRLMVFCATLVALYGIFQYFFRTGYQSEAWVDSDMFSSITFRVPSTFQNPNMTGQYLLLMIPLGGACLLGAKEWDERILYLFCCGAMVVCMLLTFARGAWLGLLAAGVIFLLLLAPRLILLAPIALVVLALVLPDVVISRFTSIGDLSDNSTSYRLSIWIGSAAMLKDYWLCGIGPGTEAFNLVYPLYSLGTADAQHSHSLYLQTLCDGGVFTLFALLATLLSLARVLCISLTKKLDWQMRLWLVAILAGLAGFLVQGATDYSFYNYRVAMVFWAFVGTGIAAGRLARKEAET